MFGILGKYKYAVTAQIVLLGIFFIFSANTALAEVDINAVVAGTCGNNNAEIGEQCDGSDLAGASCQSLGYATGTLSCSGACSYNVSSCVSSPPASSGSPAGSAGGGSLSRQPQNVATQPEFTRVVLEGVGYPRTGITLLLDGQFRQSSQVNSSSEFRITTRNLSPGLHTFIIYTDDNEINTRTESITIDVAAGTITQISGLVMPPAINQSSLRRVAGNLMISGRAVANTPLTIRAGGDLSLSATVMSSASGRWQSKLSLPPQYSALSTSFTTNLEAQMNYAGDTYASQSTTKHFFANATTATTSTRFRSGDINSDGRTNIVDFYIMRYWWHFARDRAIPIVDLTGDNQFDLADFSVLVSFWSGQ